MKTFLIINLHNLRQITSNTIYVFMYNCAVILRNLGVSSLNFILVQSNDDFTLVLHQMQKFQIASNFYQF